jgi:hypothetical protein
MMAFTTLLLASKNLLDTTANQRTIKMSTKTDDPIRDVRTPNPIDLNYIRKAHWVDCKPESYNGSNLLSCLESIEMGLLIRNASYILDKRMPNDDDINRILMSFLKRALGDRGKYLLHANEDFPTSWKPLRQMHASKQKSELPRLERELLLKQQLLYIQTHAPCLQQERSHLCSYPPLASWDNALLWSGQTGSYGAQQ